MSFLLIVLIICAIIALYFYWRQIYNHWERQGVPSVSCALPIVGHLLPLLLLRKNFSQLVQNWYNQYSESSMVGYYDGMLPGLLIRDPELIKSVLVTNFSSFNENAIKVSKEADPLVSKNPFFTTGEEWSTGRKRLAYAFTGMRLKILSETVRDVCKKFHNYLNRKIGPDERVAFETKDLFGRFTGEVVANVGLGIEGFCFDDNNNSRSFHEIGKRTFRITKLHGALQSLMIFLPFLNTFIKMRFIPKEIDQFFRTIVKQLIEKRREETEKRNDFFQLMIDLEKNEERKFDEESLASESISFFGDGYESSSATLSFVCFELSIHYDVQEKVRNEINDVLAKHNGEITYDSLKEMTYLDQVISESQRLNVLFDISIKICTNSIQLKGYDGLTCQVEPGNKIIIPSRCLQRDPKYWTNPEGFDPDRWNDKNKANTNKYCFLPFGEGPRICVGLRMGLLQTKAAIVNLLTKYRIERNPRTKYPVELNVLGVISTPVDGLWVYLKRL
ncbi:hypothetical protein M0802_002036 [Mischocyttarus mexicanus]|nr:hypothetical protein M0802_002036 [Mischocyttarus mexicanus]